MLLLTARILELSSPLSKLATNKVSHLTTHSFIASKYGQQRKITHISLFLLRKYHVLNILNLAVQTFVPFLSFPNWYLISYFQNIQHL